MDDWRNAEYDAAHIGPPLPSPFRGPGLAEALGMLIGALPRKSEGGGVYKNERREEIDEARERAHAAEMEQKRRTKQGKEAPMGVYFEHPDGSYSTEQTITEILGPTKEGEMGWFNFPTLVPKQKDVQNLLAGRMMWGEQRRRARDFAYSDEGRPYRQGPFKSKEEAVAAARKRSEWKGTGK